MGQEVSFNKHSEILERTLGSVSATTASAIP